MGAVNGKKSRAAQSRPTNEPKDKIKKHKIQKRSQDIIVSCSIQYKHSCRTRPTKAKGSKEKIKAQNTCLRSSFPPRCRIWTAFHCCE